ncbi:MAG: xanthine dehydrogenase [Clostridium botulinum]|uniref:xanthine dehydrogenase n=1 Tax=Clostridium sporogenes TaxID=1509 RepID=UPI001C60E2BA|nr:MULTISPECIES: xanthine dehydrogenase [Clostridium]MBO0555301.1 xanthine dehydrogenase [Clostridium botulinum]MBW5458509.1 xanthine dehydrogenase [Clostridium sporogenes]MDU2834278.1 xanthine dehydrogenase [Clostridium botulinum]
MEENKFKKTEYHLYNYKDIDILNQLADIKIKKLKNDISLKAIEYGEKTGKTNKFNSEVENEVIRREEYIQKELELLQQEKENRINEKELINKVMELLEYDEKKLVELRYFSKPTKSWTSIAQELNQSVDNCIKVRRKIISKISELLF